MRRAKIFISLLLVAGLASGCATPFDIGGADRVITPREVAQNAAFTKNRSVAWGGTVVNSQNLPNNTQLEVVAYPLDSNNRPKADAGPLGRFLIVQPGYIETADYAPGREVTVVGDVNETRTGKVGEAPYIYPVVSATKLQLWPKDAGQKSSEPQFHFGFGIGVIR